MEMCYAGAIAMPSSYVVMNEEEMTYTEGGGIGQVVAYQAVKHGVNIAVMACLGGGAIKCIGEAVKAMGKDGLKKAVSDALLKWVCRRTANAIAGAALGAVFDLLSLSVGEAFAEAFDRLDGKNDNQIYFSRIYC